MLGDFLPIALADRERKQPAPCACRCRFFFHVGNYTKNTRPRAGKLETDFYLILSENGAGLA